MNDFDYDVLQKKRIAASAKHRVGRTRKMTFPHELLSRKERAALNGPIKTYNLTQPMTRKEFYAMPEDLQKTYLLNLMNKYGATDGMIGAMFGVTGSAVQLLRKRLGVPGRGRGNRIPTGEAYAMWEAFLRGEPEEETPVCEEPPVCEENVEVPAEEQAPVKSAVRYFSIGMPSIHSWEELYCQLKQFPLPGEEFTVDVSVHAL